MQFESAADRQALAAAWDDQVEIRGARYDCVYTRAHVETLEISGSLPVMTLQDVDIERSELEIGSGVDKVYTFRGTEEGPFVVRDIQPDGSGFSVVVLEVL